MLSLKDTSGEPLWVMQWEWQSIVSYFGFQMFFIVSYFGFQRFFHIVSFMVYFSEYKSAELTLRFPPVCRLPLCLCLRMMVYTRDSSVSVTRVVFLQFYFLRFS